MNRDICMETTHGRKGKTKTSFKGVLNKVLVSGLILATVAGISTPAFAADVTSSTTDGFTVTFEYENSVQEYIKQIRNTINTVNEMKTSGKITNDKLQLLASQLYALEKAVKNSDDGVTTSVESVVLDAEKAIVGLSGTGATEVQVAVATVKSSLGITDNITIDTVTATNKEGVFFTDIQSHWAKESIQILADKDIVKGKSQVVDGKGTYDPNGVVTYGEFFTIATRLANGTGTVRDKIGNENWATPYFERAIELGIVGKNDFSKNVLGTVITRQDMAYILVGLAKVNGETLEIIPNIENNINDFSEIPQGRQIAVKQAYSNGLLQGKSGGNFDPTGQATRGEIATVFCRVMNYTTRPTTTASTPTDSKTIMGGYVSNVGDNKGRLLSDPSRKYDLEALSQIRMGEDDKGVYVTFTAPQLPTEISSSFTYNFSAIVHDANGDYFATNARANLKSGETKTVYFQSHEGGSIKSSQIGDASVGVEIVNADNNSMLMHQADTSSHSKAIETRYDGNATTIDFDSTSIFKGIGK